jgi:hypothetical protein
MPLRGAKRLAQWARCGNLIVMLTTMFYMEEELNNTEQTDHDWWNDLSDVVKQNINEGIADVKAGRVVSSEEFWRSLKNG